MQDKLVKTTGIHAQNRLFVIGNGFDLAHGLPTKYTSDFSKIAICNESNNLFWDLYQSECADIWSDFENLLAKPDFDNLREIFDGFAPAYLSDHESDRDSIITQADISGNLEKSLIEFASNAEKELTSTKPMVLYRDLFSNKSYYANFNYTHTLETVYEIPTGQILHVHGEVGGNSKLILGYDARDFDAGIMSEDITGHGQYRRMPTTEHIDDIEDYYIRTAYENLLKKIQAWAKPTQTNMLLDFMHGVTIDEVIVIGFSFGKVDAVYFELLQQMYPNCRFIITAHDEKDANKYKYNINENYAIRNYYIELL